MALSKSLLKRLHKQELERWHQSWTRLYNACDQHVPYYAREWARDDQDKLTALTEGKSQDELEAFDKEAKTLLAELMTELQLEQEPWSEWAKQLDEIGMPDLNKEPDLTLWPQQLVKPPCNPHPALQQMHRKRYEVTPQGFVEYRVVLYLVWAAAIWAVR
jgi:hypothetical protein